MTLWLAVIACLFFGDNGQIDNRIHIRMQMQFNFVIARNTDSTGWHAYFFLLDVETGSLDGIGDVSSTHGTEQLAFGTGL